jgi:hypothetical protein
MYALAKDLARDGMDRTLDSQVELLGRDLGPRGRPRTPWNP